ncbi:MAG TPA: hypothetical protein PLP42_03705 [Acidobacteriota bacterium]|jgi:hypothetical protein|nr:hypothetical protein [Acidobacteriota bacterium]
MRTIVCPSCQWEQVGGEECQRCGIIFDRYRPPEARPIFQQEVEEAEEGLRPPPTLWRKIFRIARIVSPAITVLIIGLIFNLPAPPKIERDTDATARAQQKIAGVQQAIVNRASPYDLHFSETELNSVLALALRPDNTAQLSAEEREAAESIRDLRVTLDNDYTHLYVAFRLYGKMLTLSITGKVRVEDRQLRLDAESGRLGSLPLPSFVLERAMYKVFDAPENREKFRLPPHIKDIRVEDSQIVLSVDPAASS